MKKNGKEGESKEDRKGRQVRKVGNLNSQHEKLRGRVAGELEGGYGMGNHQVPCRIERSHSPIPSIIYSK